MPNQDVHLSITRWIDGLKHGDADSAEQIWHHYFERLVRLAKQRLDCLPRGVSDEEDVALSALKSFFLGARAQKFPQLEDRADLWKLLVIVTTRKVMARQRRHFAAKRPDRDVVRSLGKDDACDGAKMSHVLGREPSPEFAALFADQVNHLLTVLPGDEFRKVALMRLEGYTNREIAEKLNWYEVKVERRLRIIRKCWSSEMESPDE